MNIFEDNQCVLKSHYIIIDEIKFCRKEAITSMDKLKSSISRKISKKEDNCSVVTLSIDISSPCDEFSLSISVSGKFEVINCNDENEKTDLISKNTIAILFPYLRSQITLVTAQPMFNSINLPPVNINQILEDFDSAKKS